MSPAASVILPTYNRLAYLREAVDSVRAQSARDWELIVIDDGSTDSSLAWLELLGDPRIVTIACAHGGSVTALRNIGVHAARAPWIAFLDSDDRWRPDKLDQQLAFHERHPEFLWSYSNRRMIGPDGSPLPEDLFQPWRPHSGPLVEAVLTLQANIAAPSVMVRRRALLDVGAFDEHWRFGGDYELWLRLAERYECGVITEVLVDIRSYASSTFGTPDVNLGLAEMYRTFGARTGDGRLRHIARRRRALHLVRAADEMLQCGDRASAARTMALATLVRPHARSVMRAWLRLLRALAAPVRRG